MCCYYLSNVSRAYKSSVPKVKHFAPSVKKQKTKPRSQMNASQVRAQTNIYVLICYSLQFSIHLYLEEGDWIVRSKCASLSFTHSFLCRSLLCLLAVCWTSCWHYFSPFHKGVLTTACLCSLYTKCTAERDPFWARGFLKQAICNCSALYMAWGKRTGTYKVDSYTVRPATKNSFILSSCCGQNYSDP